MSEENSSSKKKIEIPVIEKSTVFKYLKIAAVFFIIPAWVVIFINESAVLWKTFSWLQQDIAFWENKNYIFQTVLIALMPIIYFVWFYYLVIQKVAIALNKDFFQDWFVELGELLAGGLINLEAKRKIGSASLDLGSIMIFINKKISKLPKILAWVARKLIDKIPLVEFINSFKFQDLENEDEVNLARTITAKFNAFFEEMIDSLMPWWPKFIIPINIGLLFWYIKL